MNVVDTLKQEGMRDEQITYEDDINYKDDTGFFSFRIEHGCPFVSHFVVYKDKRKGTFNFVTLYHKFRDMILRGGYTSFIAEVLPGDKYIVFDKFIQGCLGCREPYAEVDGRKYYKINLIRGIK